MRTCPPYPKSPGETLYSFNVGKFPCSECSLLGHIQWQHQQELLGRSARHFSEFQISEDEECEYLGNKVMNNVSEQRSLGGNIGGNCWLDFVVRSPTRLKNESAYIPRKKKYHDYNKTDHVKLRVNGGCSVLSHPGKKKKNRWRKEGKEKC